ncbi:alpha/beta hydrolase [Tsukamurella soli]|uniref:Alpha/beta-hydrolase family protein n=1 Tax=Tsukamurella soli TaxID=644556 RepID=A0ABP8K0I9_9ACTN
MGEPTAAVEPEPTGDGRPDGQARRVVRVGPARKARAEMTAAERAASRWWQRNYTCTGTAVGLVLLWLSLTPSLLPRGPLFQGLVSGSAGAIGYGLGVFAVWLVQYLRSKDSTPPPPHTAWMIVFVAGLIGTVGMIVWFDRWQREVRDLMGVPHLVWHDYPLIAALSLVVLFALVELARGLRALVLLIIRQLERVAPPRLSGVVAVAVVVAVGIALINGVVVRVAMSVLNSTFSAANNEEQPDQAAPTSSVLSGGPGSLASWASLGREGRVFVSSSTTVAKLTAFNGAPAVAPIRAYAGLGSVPSGTPNRLGAIADLAVRELVRAGGLKRKVIAVATTTGTGWINEAEADALEYMYNGDTAIVSMQYSYLPSWLSFLVDKENARQAGQDLFEAVSARVRALPEGQRPKLVVFGESLGSFGGEAPFLSANNIIARTDGALFSGPTFNNTMWRSITANRDPGSPERLPVYQQGRNVRFAATGADLSRPAAPWGYPRIVYLQHPSDPIGWWNVNLLFREPDWLREPRGADVLSSVHWIPIVTFLQVSADMAVAANVPDGHGHHYVAAVADAWAAILDPPGWTPEKTARLRPLLNDQG